MRMLVAGSDMDVGGGRFAPRSKPRAERRSPQGEYRTGAAAGEADP